MNRLIRDYLDDAISQQDLIKFQMLMNSDTAFAEEVRQLKMIDDFLLTHHNEIMNSPHFNERDIIDPPSLEKIDTEIDHYLANKIAQKTLINSSFNTDLNKVHAEYCNTQDHDKSAHHSLLFSFKYRVIAAIVIVLCISGIVLYLTQDKKYSPKELYTNYYTPYIFNYQTKGVSKDHKNSLLNMAMENCNQAYYKTAIITLNNLKNENSHKMIANFILGHSFMGLKKYQQAINCFKIIIEGENSSLTEESEWYLGLCYLAIGDKKNAKIIFTQLSKDKFFGSKASEILRELE